MPISGVCALACDVILLCAKLPERRNLLPIPRIETPMAACLNGIKGEAIARAGLHSYDSVPDESLAGVDTADSAFWQGAMELFSSKAEQLEELTQES